MIVTGSRVSRKARDSTTPVDVITSAQLARTGQPNLVGALITTNASINTKAMGADTANLTSSIRLRGLNPNQTLVLIDGKRRNGTSNITADGGPEGGATPVDINLIPAAAIDHIEVLRDGAAAQYGSDAIAGVVNVILKKNASGSVSFLTGANAYNGDGWQYQFDADKGFYFGNDGYVHASFQSYHADHFVTNTVDDRAAAGGFPANSNKILSTPEETRQTASLAWGSTVAPDFIGGLQTYGFVSYGRRYAESYENYRTPTRLPQVWPIGFSPLETVYENQYGATLGLKAPDMFGFHVDLSTTWGQDNLDIGNKNTANTRLYSPDTAANYAAILQYGYLGGYTPTTVRAQTMITSQWTNNLDFSRAFHVFRMPMTLAFGAEERMEDYKLGSGDPASWLLGGTQGFAGLLPSNAGQWHRDVWAGYIDDDMHPLKQWDLDLAGRYEYYTDSQHTFTGKVSTRYDFTKQIAVRGTVGNGFRAPTLAEEHFSALNVSPTGAQGILAANSPAASAIGAIPLKPERSWNIGGGIVLAPVQDMTVTVDVYQINIRDRVVLAGGLAGDAAAEAIEATGTVLPVFSAANNADVSAQYFANGVSTRTQGLDLNWNYLTRFGRWGRVTWTADLDLNRTRVTHIGNDSTPDHNPYANAQTVGWLTTASPRSKLILNAFWQIQKFDVNVRQTRWGQTKNNVTYQDQETDPNLQYSNQYFYEFKNTPRWTTDLEVGYRLLDNLHLAVGGNNLFNIRPRRMPGITSYLGVQYYDIDSAQVPMTGGFYYGRVNLTF
ncbi:TonB-dependent receptor [Endobacter medicaginis]|uniref:TonB-dependent receptor n=1 Tax=Endobacter medicaginis TaxID=1181271 RepID=A0A850NRJ5_9PROT|nr:TonB-dependent receptor [Endobacter medicaginis]